MNERFRMTVILAAVGAVLATIVAIPVVAAEAPPQPVDVCGPQLTSSTLVDPPSVVVGDLPLDASGEHELILAVHAGKLGFCYRYRWNGVFQTMQPTIRIHRGERFALRLVNDLDAPSRGESLRSSALPACMPMKMTSAPPVVHAGYLNHRVVDRQMLNIKHDTNIHLHGFQGPADQENVFLSTLSTPMHACEYHIEIPRSQPVGTYFYHSHAHGLSGIETFLGLDGIWIVEPDVPVHGLDDHVVILRDALPEIDDNMFAPGDGGTASAAAHEQSVRSAPPVRYDPFAPPPWPSAFALRAGENPMHWNGCNSVFNDPLVSVNGAIAPVGLNVGAASAVLLRTLNGTADSFKTIQLRDAAGHRVPMRIMALDGTPVGASEDQYIVMTTLMLPPSGRADILVSPKAGTDLVLYSAHDCSNRGPLNAYALRHDLLRIHPVARSDAASRFAASAAIIAQTPAAKLLAYARAHPWLVKRRAMTYTQYAFAKNGKIKRHVSMYITDTTKQTFQEHQFWPVYAAGGTAPANADVVVKRGSIEEWTLFNATMEAHTFHIHQMTFVAQNQSGIPLTLDDVVVPFGKLLPNKADPLYPLVQPSATRILLDFRNVPRGTFVFHCHILPHEDEGMMGIIRVE